MRRTLIVLSLAAVFLVCAATGAQAGPKGVRLSPQQETTDVDSRGSGFFSYSVSGNELCYTLEVADLTEAPFAAHIHVGPRRIAGGVVVGLLTPPAATSSVAACITAVEGGALTPQELSAIVSDPRAHYVNVHTNSYPGGEIRGQLR